MKEIVPEYFEREDAIQYTKDGVLDVPEGVTTLACDFAYFVVREDLPKVHTLIIPKSVTLIETMRGDPSEGPVEYKNNPFSRILVNAENAHYTSCDGVLFSKDMKKLICYPCGRPGKSYQVPDGVKTIEKEAFLNVEQLAAVRLPVSLRCIEAGAFAGCERLDFPDIVTIYRHQGKNVITLPLIRGNDYDRNTEKINLFLTGRSIEHLDEAALANADYTQMEPVSDYCDRLEAMKQLWTIIEDWDWMLEHEALYECLNRFRAVFYSDY